MGKTSDYTDAQKAKVVARLISGESTVGAEVKKTGLRWATIYNWARKPELGGIPGWHKQGEAQAAPAESTAPTEAASPPPGMQHEIRRTYSPELRETALARYVGGERASLIAKELGIDTQIIFAWARRLGIKGRQRTTNGAMAEDAHPSGLPTMPRAQIKRALPIVATSFSCPHCGGPIVVPK